MLAGLFLELPPAAPVTLAMDDGAVTVPLVTILSAWAVLLLTRLTAATAPAIDSESTAVVVVVAVDAEATLDDAAVNSSFLGDLLRPSSRCASGQITFYTTRHHQGLFVGALVP